MRKIFTWLQLLLFFNVTDAQSWTGLGSGMNDHVHVVAEHNGALYAGGRFTMAGGVSANRIAKWNGSSWAALGLGMDTYVDALAVYNTEIYAGGHFTTADGNAANHIARWNGSSWTALGSGMDGFILTLAVYNGELYAGGSFTTAGGNTANNIAKWNGTSWSAVGTGMNNQVRSLIVYSGALYAGGQFTQAGGNTANYIAKWNGTSWSNVGNGFNSFVNAFAVYNDELYTGGNFTTADGSTANHIAKWTGSSWEAIGSGTDNQVKGLVVIDPVLYVSGWFLNAGGVSANYVAKWDDTSWSAVGSGMNSNVNALTTYNGEVYAGGIFTMADGNTVNYIASWSENCTSAPNQPGTITGNNSVCQGSSQTYSISPVNGATSYSWTLPSGWTGNSTSTSITVIVGANGGTISVTANNACGSSAPQTLAVTVTSVPNQPGTITGSISVCQGSSQSYSISPVNGATSYTWILPNGWTGNSTTTSIITTVGANSGSISVTANNNCGMSTAQTLAVTVNSIPAQPGDISGNNSVCQGSTQTYSIIAVNGATSYEWTLPSGWTGSSTTTSIEAEVGVNGGSISVTANNNCGMSFAQTLVVTVNSIPAQPGLISGNNSVCENSSETYSIVAVIGATSYTWTLPSGWTGNSTTNSITTTVGVNGGSLSVKANNNCGTSTEQIMVVTVNSAPDQPGAIIGNNTVCQGSSETYSIDPVNGATSYTWMFPSGWMGSSSTNSITTTVGSENGNISVIANNSCGGSDAQSLAVTVSPVPAQPGAISGSNSVCEGSSLTYSISPVNGATSYTWTLPSGWTGISDSTSITLTVGASGEVISVTANNNCGISNPQTLAITINPVPAQPGSITGNNVVCNGTSQTYSISEVSGASSYMWILPSGWSGTSTTTSITATVGESGDSISVTANNSCGSSPAQILPVTVHSIPAQPDTINGNNFVCPGTSQTYFVSPVNGATSYTWILPSGWSGMSDSTSIASTVGVSGGNILLIASNSCGNSNAQTLGVTVVNAVPLQPGAINGSNSVCQGSAQTYSIDEVSGASSYTWTLPSGWTGNSTTNIITANVGTDNGNIEVTANNGCGSSPAQTIDVTVEPIPAQPGPITGSTSANVGEELNYTIDDVNGATGYNWSVSEGGTITSGQNTTSLFINWEMPGNHTLSVNATNDCGAGNIQTLNINVSDVTGVIEAGDPFEIKIMPNPFQEEVYLKADGVMDKEIFIEILNLSGQTIYRRQFRVETNDYSQLLRLENVASGLYEVEIMIDGKVYIKTIAASPKS